MKIYTYVFGPGVGESIVLQYPKKTEEGYHWGVIDCHSKEILNFLRDEKKVEELDFVCWTHPHDDHHKGMPDLLEAYKGKITRFWRSGAFSKKDLLKFYHFYTKNTNWSRESSAVEQIIDFALEQKKIGPNSFKTLTGVHQGLITINYTQKCQFKVSSVSPASSIAYDYTSRLGHFLDKMVTSEGGHINLDPRDVDGEHNNISVVLLVEFGKTRLLFGADAEQKSWNYIVNCEERQNQEVKLESDFVKVSHHGSENGYHPDAWTEIAQSKTPQAVVTPFTPSGLPTDEGLALLKKTL